MRFEWLGRLHNGKRFWDATVYPTPSIVGTHGIQGPTIEELMPNGARVGNVYLPTSFAVSFTVKIGTRVGVTVRGSQPDLVSAQRIAEKLWTMFTDTEFKQDLERRSTP